SPSPGGGDRRAGPDHHRDRGSGAGDVEESQPGHQGRFAGPVCNRARAAVTVTERVLVTGGAGFIGANACNILAASGYAVTALDNLSLGKRSNLDPACHFVDVA